MNANRTHFDLFSGLGCFAIAARHNGVATTGFCEREERCARFLEAQWRLPVHRDIKQLEGTALRGTWLLTGGPPCQPASRAGKQLGSADDRWLWPETVRVTAEAKPTWFLYENPSGVEDVGIDRVLADLESLGYEIGVLEIPASAVNAPQKRARLWIVGNAKGIDGGLLLQPRQSFQAGAELARTSENCAVAGTNGFRCIGSMQPDGQANAGRTEADERVQDRPMANADALQRGERLQPTEIRRRPDNTEQAWMGAGDWGLESIEELWRDTEWIACGDGKYRRAKSGIRGLANGAPAGLLEALGNAIVWPVAARIIGAMIESEN